MERSKVIIFLHNSLAALGVQCLLADAFEVTSHVVSSINELLAIPADGFDYIITDTQYFVENLRILLPRKTRTLIVTDHPVEIDGECNMIDATISTEQLIETFSSYLGESEEMASSTILSQRETEVLRLVASGCINKEIADHLNISINTVLTHRKNITAKLGIKSVSGLSFYAMMNGIIEPHT